VADLAQEILGITKAKSELPSRIKRLQSGLIERVVIVRQNSPVAVILSADEYDRIRRLEATQEFMEDLMLLVEAKEKDDGTRVSLDDLKAKHGIE
jgi:prevent-host-death family protein